MFTLVVVGSARIVSPTYLKMSALAGILNFDGAFSPREHRLAWDGRLDNRHDLLSRGDIDRCATDTEIVMASYVRSGPEFLSQLVGDFALSLWEPATRTLILARDAFGTRPIYYVATPHRIAWSSDLASFVDLSPVEIDEDYIASYLNSAPDVTRTAYKHIRSVPPGVALIIRDNQMTSHEFWRPFDVGTIHYRHDEEYEEQFRELFRDAVRCRLRSDRPVWAELSGGLDSSSIVCMADQIVESGEITAPPVETVSYVYDNSAGSDERRFINDVEQKRGRVGFHFHEDDAVGRYRDLDLASVIRPNPTFRFTQRHAWVRERMQRTASRVLLSGVGGDNLLWSGAGVSPQLADLLVRFKMRSLHKQVRSWSEATLRSYGETLWQGAIVPLLPQRFETNPSTLVHRRFARRVGMKDGNFRLPSDRINAAMLSVAVGAVASCYYRDRTSTEYRFPFLHRPLVEFLLAIPIDQKLRPSENRSVQRRALKHILPDSILTRQSKRWPTEALCRTLANNWSEVEWLFQNPRVCDYGFVDAAALKAAARRVQHGLQNVAGELSLILSTELWLRALEVRKEERCQSRKTA